MLTSYNLRLQTPTTAATHSIPTLTIDNLHVHPAVPVQPSHKNAGAYRLNIPSAHGHTQTLKVTLHTHNTHAREQSMHTVAKSRTPLTCTDKHSLATRRHTGMSCSVCSSEIDYCLAHFLETWCSARRIASMLALASYQQSASCGIFGGMSI